VLTDVNGCTDEECVSVIVTEDCGELFIPTAFSPNEDGNNDYFKVKINPSCVQEMNLRVFDRWGELVFETDRIDQYWDGKYKGKELDPAVFAYLLIIKISGNEQEILQKGNVTLLK
jgi:gliding motility-associated-like protein